jgi:YD repeat-containing protein
MNIINKTYTALMNTVRSFSIVIVVAVAMMIAGALTVQAQNQETYSYDSMGRLTKVVFADTTSIEYAYDKNGNILFIRGSGKVIPNEAPTSTSASITTDEDTESVPVTPTVVDANDGDTHTFIIVSQPSNGTASIVSNKLVYIPDKDYNGNDSFTYKATDQGALSVDGTASVTVTPVNDKPIAVDDNVSTPMDTQLIFDPRTNDSDVDGDQLILVSLTQPSNGASAMLVDDNIEYTPFTSYTGPDSFDYVITDGNGESATGTVNVTVTTADDPIAKTDLAVTDEDIPVVIDVLSNDISTPPGSLTIESFTQPSNGSVTETPDSKLEYSPEKDFSGGDSFEYTVKDQGGKTATGNVSITVRPVNDKPGVFTRLTPPDASTTSNPVTFSWSHSLDPDLETVEYTLSISVDGQQSDDTMEDSSSTVDFSSLGLSTGPYQVSWELSASDGIETVSPVNGSGTFTLDFVTGIEEVIADGFALGQNYPNPFGNTGAVLSTVIPYSLERTLLVTLTVHDGVGREIARLVDERLAPGSYTASFSADELPAGTYHYILKAGGQRLIKRMVIMR